MASDLFRDKTQSSNSILDRFKQFNSQFSPESAQKEVQRLRQTGQMTEQQYQMLSWIAKSLGGK